MAALDLNHIIGPFSRVVRFKGVGTGFYLLPHNDAEPDGWGKPYVDTSGKPVDPPGTPVSAGGTDPHRKLAYDADSSQWRVVRFPGDWVYGNVDWRGPQEGTQGGVPFKLKLSFNGPPTRYFPYPGFIYGSDASHNEIYIQGKYADVAPLPVLGASYFEYTHPVTSAVTEHIAVVCRDGLEDVLYIRPRRSPIAPKVMDSTIRAEAMKVYNTFTTPLGWVEVLRVPRQTTDGEKATYPETPWFFSENGLECQTIRRFSKEFDNGVQTVNEIGANRYKINITSPFTASFLNYRNKAGFTARAYAVKESEPYINANWRLTDWTDLEPLDPDCAICYFTDIYTYPTITPEDWHMEHFYGVDHITFGQEISGEYYVGVDYYGNDEILITCQYDIEHEIEKYWRYCIDHKVAATLGNPGNLRPWDESAPDSPNQWDFTRTHYWDQPLDGMRFEDWAWYDTSGNPTTTIQCEACTGYADPGEDLTKILGDYLAAGGATPPDTVFNTQYQLPTYRLNGKIKLKWYHPSEPAVERTLVPHQVEVGGVATAFGAIKLSNEKLSDRVYFEAQIQHLDVRIPEGPFVVYRSELIKRTGMGAASQYHPAYDSGLEREGYVNSDGTVHTVPWNPYDNAYTGDGSYTSNSGIFTVWDSNNYHNHEWKTYASRADVKEEVRYEYVDPFTDPAVSVLIALEEGTQYSYWNEKDNLDLDVMKEWNPVTSTASTHEPQAVDTGTDGGGTWNHDWRRNNFDWEYEITTLQGAFISEQNLVDESMEPHINDGLKGAYGRAEWPLMWDMLGAGATDIYGGFAWMEERGVCFSFEYRPGTSDKPVTEPTADALKTTKYVNYVTDGDLDNAVPPADRFYPIGVE